MLFWKVSNETLVKFPKNSMFTLRFITLAGFTAKLVTSGWALRIAKITDARLAKSKMPTGTSKIGFLVNCAPSIEVLAPRYVIITDIIIAFKLIIMLALLSAIALSSMWFWYMLRNMVSMPRLGWANVSRSITTISFCFLEDFRSFWRMSRMFFSRWASKRARAGSVL